MLPFKKVVRFWQLKINTPECQVLMTSSWYIISSLQNANLINVINILITIVTLLILTSSNMLILSSTMKRVLAAINSLIPSKSSSNSARDLILMSLKWSSMKKCYEERYSPWQLYFQHHIHLSYWLLVLVVPWLAHEVINLADLAESILGASRVHIDNINVYLSAT